MSIKYQLKNGMDVILTENHKSPVVSVQMWVKTGSANEPKHLAGISHFIEHLLFKGTQKFGVGEIASYVEGSGGELNAYTSFDQTVFHVTIANKFEDVALEVISQMMGFPTFVSDEIDNEREVVIEEIKRGQDSLGHEASQLLFSTMFKEHPYGIPIIGYEEVIRRLSREDILNYFNERYVPKNMFLLITGDFEKKKMRQKVKNYFGSFTPRKLKRSPKIVPPQYGQPCFAVEKSSFEESVGYLAWPIPPVNHKDIPALDILSMILGYGESSRLVKALSIDEHLVQGVGVSTYTPRQSGLFTVSLVLNQSQLTKALRVCGEHLLNIMTTPPTAEEFQKTVTNLQVEELFYFETVDGIAKKIGELEFLLGDHKYFEKYMKQIRSLNPEDICKVAQKYLAPQNFHGVLLASSKGHDGSFDESFDEKAALEKWQKNYEKEFLKNKKQRDKAKNSTGKTKKISLKKNNLVLGKLKNQNRQLRVVNYKSGYKGVLLKTQETPVVCLKAAFLAGSRQDPKNQEGLCGLFSRIWGTQTSLRDESQINEEIENLGVYFSTFSGRNTAGLSMSVVKNFQKPAFEIFVDILSNTKFSQKILEREKKALVEQIKSRNDNPSRVATNLFHKKIFSGHPYAIDPLGSIESINSITIKDIEEFWEKISYKNNFTFSLAGNFENEEALKPLKKGIELLGERGIKQKKYSFEGPLKNEFVYKYAKKEQSHIILGFKGLDFKSKTIFDLQVLQAVLGGQGGRLFLELRDKESLAYTVSPMHLEGIDAGYFGVYIGCSPEKTEKSIRMLRIEFEKLIDKPVSKLELERAKNYLMGTHGIGLQRTSSLCGALLFNEVYDLPAKQTFEYNKNISKVSTKSIHKLCQKIFSQNEVLSLVGPKQPKNEIVTAE